MIQYLVTKHKCNLGVGMNIQPTNQQPISDDQELAKVLAGINQQSDDQNDAANQPSQDTAPAVEQEAPSEEPAEAPQMPETLTPPDIAPPALSPAPSAGNSLDEIKQAALGELRPLVDKLNVPADEKFDTYLLLLRSTDDRDLIAPAHEAARAITDEARRAQALLDIIKEIDYLSNAQPAA